MNLMEEALLPLNGMKQILILNYGLNGVRTTRNNLLWMN